MKDTSRTAALDYMLAIGNLIALADHKEEQVLNLLEEKETLPTVTSNEEELHDLTEAINRDIANVKVEARNLYETRKELQRNFFQIYNIDMEYWCQVKHYAVALTAMEECRNADNTVQNDALLTMLRKQVYQFLGTALGVGPANCGRCLADMLEETKHPQNLIVSDKDNWIEVDEGQAIPEGWHYESIDGLQYYAVRDGYTTPVIGMKQVDPDRGKIYSSKK